LAPLIQPGSYQTNPSPPCPDKIQNEIANLPLEVVSSSREDTLLLGKNLSLLLNKGSVVALKGPLGAGKTCLAKGLIAGLGVKELVTSPSYPIVSEYKGTIQGESVPVYHIDAYRLAGNEDFSAIGGEEMIFGDGVSIIEWCENVPDFIRTGALGVDIQILEDEKRRFNIFRVN